MKLPRVALSETLLLILNKDISLFLCQVENTVPVMLSLCFHSGDTTPGCKSVSQVYRGAQDEQMDHSVFSDAVEGLSS